MYRKYIRLVSFCMEYLRSLEFPGVGNRICSRSLLKVWTRWSSYRLFSLGLLDGTEMKTGHSSIFRSFIEEHDSWSSSQCTLLVEDRIWKYFAVWHTLHCTKICATAWNMYGRVCLVLLWFHFSGLFESTKSDAATCSLLDVYYFFFAFI